MIVDFKFIPLQYVTIRIFELGYIGRVQGGRITANNHILYTVEYGREGQIYTFDFREDEIEAVVEK